MAKTTCKLQLIAGLANPGPEYSGTRHNAGAWFVEELARRFACSLTTDKKAKGLIGSCSIAGAQVRLLIPDTYMNLSGDAVAALANFYKIPAENILIAHDELDIPIGTAKLKQGGGHGGHNGLRDIIKKLGNNRDFMRLRLGIDHPRNATPGKPNDVVNYVLRKPPLEERIDIDRCIDECVKAIEVMSQGDWQQAQMLIHSYKPPENV